MTPGSGGLRAGVEARAARGYVTGGLEEALSLAQRLDAQGVACTLGYWDGPGAPGAAAAGQARAALRALDGLDGVIVAVKAPPLLAGRTPQAAAGDLAPVPPPVRVVVDAPAPGAAAGAVALALALADRGCDAGIALPGRWRRSVEDAEVAVERGLAVRLVKGEHADPSGGAPSRRGASSRSPSSWRAVPATSAWPATTPPRRGRRWPRCGRRGRRASWSCCSACPPAVAAVARRPWRAGARLRPVGDARVGALRGHATCALARRLLGDAVVGQRRWRRTLQLQGAAAPRPQHSIAG